MWKYTLKRVFWACITLLVILFVLFLLLDFMPGSPFNTEKLTAEQLEILRRFYGLDRPFFEKFFIFLKNALRGDFGISYSILKNAPVSSIVLPRLGVSIRLGFQALLLGSIFGVLFGTISGSKQNSWADTISTVIAVIGVSVPSFVFALTLSFTLGYKLGWFPLTFITSQPFLSSILPTISLSMFIMAQVTRFLRTEFVEVLDSEYIKLARVKGLPRKQQIFGHGFRNALISVITIYGPLVVNVLTGSLVVEKIFSIPGIGSMLVTAIQSSDYNVIVMIAFIYSALYIVVNLIVDILYGVIDPRIRVGKGA
ncbi:peptide ABC transporter permease [Erysipelothrix larvae]|uniref:Peptide ABC transporter permease n=1 Tax=Erysipelothrix larvae TaxID=1514105 RepID=A0A0X8GY74_9FIRM|nr:ABC transporter permease [Erysipelothrix larvae]AMC92620.1 peptide ABC transporter permease [Erysipelothrix larvae]